METKTADILMLGGIGSGKSSVLAAIYEQAAILAQGIDLKIGIDEATVVPLVQNLMAIKSAFDSEDEVVEIDRFPNAKDKIIEYIFEIGRLYSPPDQKLRFNDISGEDFSGNPKLVNSLLSKCRTAILAIDVVELMKSGTTKIPLDKRRNSPEMVYHYIQKWIEISPDVPRLLVIVPIKTETWMRERIDLSEAAIKLNQREISAKIKEVYKASLDLLAKDPENKDSLDKVKKLDKEEKLTAIVIAPVQTVGNLIFHEYVLDGNKYPIEKWKKIVGKLNNIQSSTGFSPVNCDQPLRFILNFYMIQAIIAERAQKNNKSWIETKIKIAIIWIDVVFGTELEKHYENIRNTFLDIFGADSHLAYAVATFSAEINTEFPFEILQGNNLLQRKTILNYFV